jgi:enoyl-CoA hydratase/carnithine racemase
MTVRVEENDTGVLTATISREAEGNRIDRETIDRLCQIYEEADPLKGKSAVILLKADGPDFSLGRQRPATQSANPLDIVSEFERIQKLNHAVQKCRAVTLSALQGRAEGAGLSVGARCDIVLVAKTAKLCFPEIQHGIPPTIVLSHFSYVLPRNILGDLIFGGRVLDGDEAVKFGLAARSIDASELHRSADELAAKIAQYDRRSIALVKSFLARAQDLPPSAAPSLGISMYANEMSHRLLK